MKKAQAAASSGKEYANGITDLSNLIASQIDRNSHVLAHARKNTQKALVLLIAPQKGLCGSLISNLTKYLVKNVSDLKNAEFIVVGNKAKLIAKRLKLNVLAEFDMQLSAPRYDFVPPVARIVNDEFSAGKFSSVLAVYSEFVNTMVQYPKSKILLPLELAGLDEYKELALSQPYDKGYLFEPNVGDIVDSVFKMYLEVEIYQLLLESYASEQSARMVAMKNATDNASNLIENLTLEYNKLRQAGITNEILDIGNHMFIGE